MSHRYYTGAVETSITALVRAQGWAKGERHVAASSMKLVLLNLADHSNGETSYAWPALATIARETELDPRTVRTALAKLVRIGTIEIVTPATPRRSATYAMLTPRAGSTPTLEPEPGQAGSPPKAGAVVAGAGRLAADTGELPTDPLGTNTEPSKEPSDQSGAGPDEPDTLTPTLPFEPPPPPEDRMLLKLLATCEGVLEPHEVSAILVDLRACGAKNGRRAGLGITDVELAALIEKWQEPFGRRPGHPEPATVLRVLGRAVGDKAHLNWIRPVRGLTQWCENALRWNQVGPNAKDKTGARPGTDAAGGWAPDPRYEHLLKG